MIIKSYLTPAEAHVMQSLLESENIFCVLQDEDTNVMMPYLSNAIGGVKLAVHEADAERAVSLLKEAGYIKEEVSGKNFFKENKGLTFIIIVLLLVFLYYFLQTVPGFSLW